MLIRLPIVATNRGPKYSLFSARKIVTIMRSGVHIVMKRSKLYSFTAAASALLLLINPAHCSLIDCDSDHLLLKNHEDVASISACKNIRGSITIGGDVRGEVSLDDIETIGGRLLISHNPYITKVGGKRVQRLGDFYLEDLQSLSEVEFPRVVTAELLQAIDCPSLRTIDLKSIAGLWGVNMIRTGLNELNLRARVITWIRLFENPFLHQFSILSVNVAEGIRIVENARNISIELPHLLYTRFFEFKRDPIVDGTSDRGDGVIRLPSLRFTSLLGVESITIQSHYPMGSLIFPKLQSVGGAVELVGDIDQVIAFGLKQVDGTFHMAGHINNFNVDEPVLFHDDVYLSSSDPEFNCSTMDTMRRKKFVDGSYSCQIEGNVSEWSDTSVSIRRAQETRVRVWKSLIAVSTAICFLGIIVLLLVRRFRNKRTFAKSAAMLRSYGDAIESHRLLDPGVDFSELPTNNRSSEIQTESEARELSDNHGLSELIEQTRESRNSGSVHELSDTSAGPNQD